MVSVHLQTSSVDKRFFIDIDIVMFVKESCLLLYFFLLLCGTNAMTRQQMKNTGKMLKSNCIKKTQVAEDMVSGIEQGKFIEDKKVMCYIACIFEMSNVVKNNKLNLDASLKQIDMMYPPEIKESAKAAVMSCKDVQKKYKDICEASYWTTKCLYEFKPEDFLFP